MDYARAIYLVGRSHRQLAYDDSERAEIISFILFMMSIRKEVRQVVRFENYNGTFAMQSNVCLGKNLQRICKFIKYQHLTEEETTACNKLLACTWAGRQNNSYTQEILDINSENESSSESSDIQESSSSLSELQESSTSSEIVEESSESSFEEQELKVNIQGVETGLLKTNAQGIDTGLLDVNAQGIDTGLLDVRIENLNPSSLSVWINEFDTNSLMVWINGFNTNNLFVEINGIDKNI